MPNVDGARALTALLATLAIGLLSGCMDASLISDQPGSVGLSIQAAPSTLRDVGLRVSGPGMSTRSVQIPLGTDALVIPVPVGPAREFELLARLNRVGTNTLNSSVFYDARQQVAVPPGGTQVDLPLFIRSTILIPNVGDTDGQGTPDPRLSEITDLSGSTPEIDGKWNTGPTVQNPYDVEIGAGGVIYVVSDIPVGQPGGPRFGSINRIRFLGDTLDPISAGDDYTNIAVDRENGRIYAAKGTVFPGSGGGVWRMTVTGAGEQQMPLSSGLQVLTWGKIQGLAVAPDGSLYVAQSRRVGRFSPADGTLISGFDATPLSISDILVRPDGVYLLINSRDGTNYSPAGVAIVRLPLDLSGIQGTFGSTVDPVQGIPGSFFGPLEFLARTNREITLIDSDFSTAYRIVQISGFGPNGWREYGRQPDGVSGTEPGEIVFYPYGWGI